MLNYRADTIWEIGNTDGRWRERIIPLIGIGLQDRSSIFLRTDRNGTGLAMVFGER